MFALDADATTSVCVPRKAFLRKRMFYWYPHKCNYCKRTTGQLNGGLSKRPMSNSEQKLSDYDDEHDKRTEVSSRTVSVDTKPRKY